jgi:hypothetical protein
MTASCEIAAMNNRAVSYMQQGENKESIRLLHQALDIVSAEQKGTENSPDASSQEKQNIVEVSIVDISGKADIAYQEMQAGIEMFTFKHAFILPEHDESCLTLSNAAMTSSILLFDLSLAYHQEGIRSGSSASLLHALTMYELTLATIQLCELQTYSHHRVVLMLAVANNMATLRTEFFDAKGLTSSLQLVQIILESEGSSTLSAEDYAWFYMNFSILFSAGTHRAAAAA